MPVSDQAFVTLATNDTYCQGALVLGQSLRNQRATRQLVVLITPQVSRLLRAILSRVFDEVVEVDLMDSADHVHLAFLRRPELGVTLTKLHCWTLTRYSKCVFLDADTLVLCNIDELFERSEFSAAPDPGWPDCFNSGVFVFRPSLRTHRLLLQHAADHGSYDGADQGLLNSFFSSWPTADIQKHLPFVYNLSSSRAYTYGPAFRQFGSRAKVVHFLGPKKPWSYKYNPQTGSVLEEAPGTAPQHQLSFLNLWWNIYHHSVLPLYERIPDEPQQPSPGHTNSFPRVEGPCANSAPRAEGPCANSAATAPGEPSETPTVVNETPLSSEAAPSEDVSTSTPHRKTTGCPEIETPAGAMPEPNPPPFPALAGVAEPQTASVQIIETQPADETGGGRSQESGQRNQEPPVNVSRDPRPEDALEVDLAVSISEISISEKVRAPSPLEQRRKWEEGHIDYMGKDAFARIQEKLDRFLQ
ncbi:glycogenin-2 isoform X1 [Myotis daubentonii]|uniref:glycogenin-2 isoform X1 n=1 Tax=Myotis daubentonii TaxID=98922 RepID=UPI00287325B5|nr:glycogenin-2 isoform X1 [Myotis daubentonii]XP_059535985.1 glycogenin-2 isoform X1 [Myotis daubentonii]